MIPPIYPQNIDNTSPNATQPTSSHICQILHIALPLTLFKSDLSPSGHSNLFNKSDLLLADHKKMHKEPVDEILCGFYCRINIKDFLPK